MQNDKDSSARTPDPPQGDLSQDERDRGKAAGKPGKKPPLAQPSTGEESLAETGQGQGQSRGKKQTQPQE